MQLVPAVLLSLILATASSTALEPFRVEIVEEGSGWPVPLVELRTVHDMRFVSDNAGVIALDLPELMETESWFHLESPGYEVAADGFGMRGVRLTPTPGGTAKVEVSRTMIAKRLGRLTGAGLFAESQKTGHDLDWIESGLVGCDSVQNAVHNGRCFWAWGDTSLARYPLGIFDMTSATTTLKPLASFQPPLKLAFDYFRDEKSVPRGVAKMPGEGPTWVSAYTSLPDTTGKARLVGTYIKVRNHLEAYICGLCVWNDEAAAFEPFRVLWTKSPEHPKQPPVPDGHPAYFTDESGKEWVYFGNPLPNLRIPATFEAWQDESQWEILKPQETLPQAGGGKDVKPHTGHIAWNEFRKRWVTVFMEAFGSPSAFGELWHAEADHPTGRWGSAVKILSHANYTFYNPRLHPEFTPTDSPIILFEGTYTAEFADKPEHTPRFNYNQILYRLDLDDPPSGPLGPPPQAQPSHDPRGPIALAGAFLLLAGCRRDPAPTEIASPLTEITRMSAELRDVAFSEVIEATTGHRVLPADPDDPLVPLLARVLDTTLTEFNLPDSPLSDLRRINEASRSFEDRIREGLDADPDYSCGIPATAQGKSQRVGYPDLRIVHGPSGRVYYLDPKLLESGNENSTLRTFYYEAKTTTSKVTEDAIHLLVGIEHDGNDGDWKFLRWHLVDLHGFRVRLKAEFQASNKDLYRPELLLREGGPIPP